jgi:benzaldehyde dehydrogenase (NAD)
MTAVTEDAQAIGNLLDERVWSGKLFSGGWVQAPDAIDVVEPATGEVLGAAGAADAAAIADAAAAATRAQPEWAVLAATERAAVLRRAADALDRHRDELATWIVRESGSIPVKARVEINASINQLHQAAALIAQPLGHVLPSLTPGRQSIARRVPLGVVGVITPWNFPVVLALRSVAPALAVGNAVLLKPDANTPVVGGVLVARIFEEAGLPDGVLHVLPGGAEVGAALVAEPRVNMISFTGSTRVGRSVGEVAGRNLKRVVLELGGNCPLVVLDDADLEAASSAGAWGSFLHQGQICMATSRHLVHESIAERYLEALVERAARLSVGNPAVEKVALGPLINERQLERVRRIVDDSVAQGAGVLSGGKSDGLFYPATVLRDVTSSMPAFAEEIFGPVAPVTTFRDDDEAVELANATEYGLAAAIQSGSPERAARLADRLRAGMVHINDQTINEEAPAPFGGFGASGNGGHFGGAANLEVFTEWQWLTTREQATPFPF